jgi:hypothetical protein
VISEVPVKAPDFFGAFIAATREPEVATKKDNGV